MKIKILPLKSLFAPQTSIPGYGLKVSHFSQGKLCWLNTDIEEFPPMFPLKKFYTDRIFVLVSVIILRLS